MAEALTEYKENITSEELDPLRSLAVAATSSATEVRKVYFALLHIHPIELDITYRSDVFQATTTIRLREAAASLKSGVNRQAEDLRRTASMPASKSGFSLFDFDDDNGVGDEGEKNGVSWAIPSLAMHIPDLDNAPVRLSALMIEHAFGTSGDLSRRVTKYYTRQLWKQLHKILGSFDFLGNPVGFLDHIGTGVRDFVYEPLEGLKVGGKGFSKGLAKGTASLVSNTLDGTFDAASKISGTFGQGLANLSLDEHYQQIRARARRRHVRGIREGLIQGSKELSLGVYEGVTGLVLAPMRGAKESGAVGFVKGTITGIIGLPVKPVAGIFDFASRASQGVRNRSRKYGKSMRRVRRPRVFGRYNELKCYNEADVIAYDLLRRTGGKKLSTEKVVFYKDVVQHVAASEIVKEARDRRKNDTLRERTMSLRRSLQELEESGGSEDGRRKLIYEVSFLEAKLGLELETDFYCENVTIKAFDDTARENIKVITALTEDQEILQPGDVLTRVGGVDVRGVGFHETLAMLRGTRRPITLQFQSAEEVFAAPAASTRSMLSMRSVLDDEPGASLRVTLTHWVIVTEERALYINVSSLSSPVVEWMTPLRYIYRVEWVRGTKISLHLSVGVDSLPTGPRLRPSLKAMEGQERDMSVFLDVMWLSFGSITAEEQELWPSDTSLNGYMLKKGGFSTVKRWFVLSRNCLYYFSSRKELRGIIPLGSVRLQADAGESYAIRITNAKHNESLVTLQVDNGQVVERAQAEIVLIAPNAQDFEMWQSSLAHAAGGGLRHSRGTRFYVATDASRLEIGCRHLEERAVAPLVEGLHRAVEVFNSKLAST
ncbi:hypothetical protein ATCC90586_004288 [Pythium insidiosum]|nr:hypothetical protein ATCC90586_004288 [Pythium insidiosum]